MRYVTTNVRLDPEDYKTLQTETRALGISLAEGLRRAVHAHVGEWRTEAREEAPVYGLLQGEPHTAAAGGLRVARVRGNELVMPVPAGLAEGKDILVHVVGPVTQADLEVLTRQHAALDALARELAGLPDEPVRLSDEDREIYK